jgi:zinc transport system substrate-binding protein
MKKTVMLLRVLVFCLLVSWQTAWGADHPRIPVFASILPQAYFLERIGGDRLDIEVLVGEGQSPETYEPTPRQMAALAEAKAWFLIGVPFEKNLMKKLGPSHPNLAMVETQKGVPYRRLSGYENGHNVHGTGHGRRGAPDPHIWMSPRLVKLQARNMCDALVRIDPSGRQLYAENLQSLLSDLDGVDARIARSLAPLRGRRMYVFHPAFGYFADAYGLIQVPVELEGKEPGARQLADLIQKAKRDGVRVIFVQPQFSRKSAELVAQSIGGAVVPINPLARDYLANLERMASAIEQGLR